MRLPILVLAIFALFSQAEWKRGHDIHLSGDTLSTVTVNTTNHQNKLEFLGESDQYSSMEKLPEEEIEEILVDEDGPDYMGMIEDDAVEFAGDDEEFVEEDEEEVSEVMKKFEKFDRFKR
mmetsp:Transcript_25683/g.45606  ORF Transcript_25683/g.45606 Transcript_25683/m.45606 type:complete len:120 (+) Transcript_25683:85-444(+)|eukprot:CAMPEP_0197543014 /NCGR_PEP_ID=MMETSP1318-20131121/68014_1 /TAXON_ID=552666 /ORGANISM="Partenskyella glossopodia, Strain RCC365" /LENGTH=119 /DNA_ID=CAMNT_0043102321 /DNA_START=469 /DNA_END=828 /DNA_ORIENTATION=-